MMDISVLAKKIRAVMPAYVARKLPKEIGVVSLSPEKSREMNNAYRKKNKPTNVLSFFYDKEYGEILVCPKVIREEGRLAGNSYEYQMTWMIVHGMLHLAGIHHEQSARAVLRVERIEKGILKKLF